MFGQEPKLSFGSNSPLGLQGGESSGSEDTTLRIESTTWSRDSHELFDYESRHVFCKGFLLRKAARIFRDTQEVSVVVEGDDLPQANVDYLVSVKTKEGRYYVYPADRSTSPQLQPRKLWLIIRHLKNESYPLSEGDVVKLGRFKLRVKQIVTGLNGDQNVDFKLDDVEVPSCDPTKEEAQHLQCRICLLEGPQDDNPLVRACQCKGSIMYVHLECLQHWVNSRLNLTDDPSRSCCFVRQLQCELCKSPFPSTVAHSGNRLNVVKVPNVQPPFIVLENLVGQPANRGVHLCSMAVKKECKLGRGHESDVRIADVSISRFHATIRFQDGEFWLEDKASKFGTLVALRRPSMIERDAKLSVQVGRTVLSFVTDPTPAAELDADCVRVDPNPNGFQPLVQRPGDAEGTFQAPGEQTQQQLLDSQYQQPHHGQPAPPNQTPGFEGDILTSRMQRRRLADPSLERLCLMDMVNASLLPTGGAVLFQAPSSDGHRPMLAAYSGIHGSAEAQPGSPLPQASLRIPAPTTSRLEESSGIHIFPLAPASGGSPTSGTLAGDDPMAGCIQGLSQTQQVGLVRMLDQLRSVDSGYPANSVTSSGGARPFAVPSAHMQQQMLYNAICARLRHQGAQPPQLMETLGNPAAAPELTPMAESLVSHSHDSVLPSQQRGVSDWPRSARNPDIHLDSSASAPEADKEVAVELSLSNDPTSTQNLYASLVDAPRSPIQGTHRWPAAMAPSSNEARQPTDHEDPEMRELHDPHPRPRPISSPRDPQDGALPQN